MRAFSRSPLGLVFSIPLVTSTRQLPQDPIPWQLRTLWTPGYSETPAASASLRKTPRSTSRSSATTTLPRAPTTSPARTSATSAKTSSKRSRNRAARTVRSTRSRSRGSTSTKTTRTSSRTRGLAGRWPAELLPADGDGRPPAGERPADVLRYLSFFGCGVRSGEVVASASRWRPGLRR